MPQENHWDNVLIPLVTVELCPAVLWLTAAVCCTLTPLFVRLLATVTDSDLTSHSTISGSVFFSFHKAMDSGKVPSLTDLSTGPSTASRAWWRTVQFPLQARKRQFPSLSPSTTMMSVFPSDVQSFCHPLCQATMTRWRMMRPVKAEGVMDAD